MLSSAGRLQDAATVEVQVKQMTIKNESVRRFSYLGEEQVVGLLTAGWSFEEGAGAMHSTLH